MRSAVARMMPIVLLATAGCSGEAKKHQAEFDVLVMKLPGKYDNRAQANHDASGQHAAVALQIQPVNALAVGHVVLFERETAADDPRRVLGQHIWTFEVDKKNSLVQTVYVFKDARRWVHAGDDPYVMQSVLPEDLTVLSGCELIWSKTDSGFNGATKPDQCKASSAAEGTLIEQSAELQGSQLILGQQIGGDDEGATSSYRFERRAAESHKD
ncbi:MAG TPA: chromophore lyase CpcT/CpeT [Steroidobacteraceae bacterium]